MVSLKDCLEPGEILNIKYYILPIPSLSLRLI